MHIDPGSGQVRHSELVGWTRAAGPGTSPGAGAAGRQGRDGIGGASIGGGSIADGGFALVARREDLSGDDGPSAERLAELRRRVARGTYDAPGVAEIIARRLIRRGDV